MKLRNKKTGEIGELCYAPTNYLCVAWTKDDGVWTNQEYNSLAELNKEWEDCKNRLYVIDMWEDDCMFEATFDVELKGIERAKECGLYFETKEEAEKAVEKLKAWKRLKDKGYKFGGWYFEYTKQEWVIKLKPETYEEFVIGQTKQDLDLLFGGEE